MRLTSRLHVNLSCLQHNLEKVRSLCPQNEIIFMVKANAYGHGLVEIVSYSFDELEVKEFGCASLSEALHIRKNLPFKECKLYVFSDTEIFHSDIRGLYLENNIVPVVHNLSDLQILLEDRSFNNVPLCVKFDTGMNRLGISWKEVDKLIKLLKKFQRKELHHILTHLSSSYLPTKPGKMTEMQLERFELVKKELKTAGIDYEFSSISNSGAIEQGLGVSESHVRPGLMTYGPRSCLFMDEKCELKNISRFETKVLKKMKIKKGDPVGYGATVSPKDGELVLLPVGYGDGLLTYAQGTKFPYEDQLIPFMGRINMDITTLLFEEDQSKKIKEGDSFLLWDHNPENIEALSQQMKTIPYQLLCAVSHRIPRHYGLQ